MTDLIGHDGGGALILERMGGNGSARGPGEGAVTPEAAGRSLFDDVTGQAEGRGRKRRSCDVQRPGRPRFRRLSEGTASRPFGHQKRPNMSARLQSDHNVPKNDRL